MMHAIPSSVSDSARLGLDFALQSITICDSGWIPTASKDRQAEQFLDDMRAAHDKARHELDEALASYQEIATHRDINTDCSLEPTLNRRFFHANNRLAKASREYDAYLDDLDEVRCLPRLSRAASKSVSTSNDLQQVEYNDLNPHDREKLLSWEARFQALERERSQLVKETRTIQTLCEHVTNVEDGNRELQSQLAYTQEFVNDLGKHLAHAESDIRIYQQQISYAKAMATQTRDENRSLKRDVEDLQYMVGSANDEILQLSSTNEWLRRENKEFRRGNEYLRHEFEEVRIQASELQRKCCSLALNSPTQAFYGLPHGQVLLKHGDTLERTCHPVQVIPAGRDENEGEDGFKKRDMTTLHYLRSNSDGEAPGEPLLHPDQLSEVTPEQEVKRNGDAWGILASAQDADDGDFEDFIDVVNSRRVTV